MYSWVDSRDRTIWRVYGRYGVYIADMAYRSSMLIVWLCMTHTTEAVPWTTHVIVVMSIEPATLSFLIHPAVMERKLRLASLRIDLAVGAVCHSILLNAQHMLWSLFTFNFPSRGMHCACIMLITLCIHYILKAAYTYSNQYIHIQACNCLLPIWQYVSLQAVWQ